MRRVQIMGFLVTALLALALVSASTASAKKANLVLREGGEHPYEGQDPAVPIGAPVETSFEAALGGCATTRPIVGEMTANGTPLDTISFNPESENEEEVPCLDEYEGIKDSMRLVDTGVSLSSKGKVKLKGGVFIAIEGPYGSEPECGYSFPLSKAKGTLQLAAPGMAGEAVVKGSVRSSGGHSNKACPKKEETVFTMAVADNGGNVLETTLEG